MAYLVSQRTHEIGIRLSLGAKPADVFKLVLGRGLFLSLSGAAIGSIAGIFLARWLKDLLFKVQPTDPATFVASIVILVVVSLLASYVPACRATRVDPLIAL